MTHKPWHIFMKKYNFQKSEKKWQKEWENKKIYQVKDKIRGKKNSMLLVEFPYPSGDLHIGYWFAFAIPDILARYKRMIGENVMYPIGFDAFGLPAENAAIKRKISPADWTEKNIKFMTKQLESMGASFDWSRKVSTMDPEYYKWTQWLFLRMYEKDLAYRKQTLANWCPSCKTGLANEQVVNGGCERCDNQVVQKELEKWRFKITNYADRLIDDLEKLNWPETTKLAQKNWIGRSEGTVIKFQVSNSKFQGEVEVFTTRPDTIFGATYVVLAPEHELIVNNKEQIENMEEVENYIKNTQKKTELERQENKEKTGVELRGIKAINPANGSEIPVWISDYVLAHYGTGAVMAVPAHDERDFDFANKFGLPIIRVIDPKDEKNNYFRIVGKAPNEDPQKILEDIFSFKRCYEGDGIMINSEKFSGMESENARLEITDWLIKKGQAKRKVNYRLHDWVLSRQRYWGVPIPIIKCADCGFVPVPDKDLPVKLPPLKDFLPTDDGRSPLAKAKSWVKVKCPKCKKMAERETDTMDTFVDSSWYFIRYTDPKNKKKFADAEKMRSWLPVPMYIGGAEHNTMHLLYSRFFTKVLHDLKLVNFKEPFVGRVNHGVILGPDGQKMSKSRGNVVNPDEEVKKYGADCVRMYLAFMGPYDQGGPWNSSGILGVKRFLDRVWGLELKVKSSELKEQSENKDLEKLLHKTIKKVGDDIKNFRFNTAISAMMILLNEMEKQEQLTANSYQLIAKILAPFAPHLTEEIWQTVLKNKKSIHLEKWPKYNLKLVKDDTCKLIVQVNSKTRGVYDIDIEATEEDAKKLALEESDIKKWFDGKEIKKIIFVPKRLINFIVS